MTAPKRYAVEWDGQKLVLAHRARAERALGRPLPLLAVVHHADGSKDEWAPLVVCPDAAYHALLHARMRIIAAGGDPNTERWCPRCKQLRPKTAFGASRTNGYCLACGAAYAADRRVKTTSPSGSGISPMAEGAK